MSVELQPNPDDPRALFKRIVDDILTQIEDGRLYPHAPLPSARKMADLYGVSVMTAQRALKDMQHQKLTYSVAGKGTFVHPDIIDARKNSEALTALKDPATASRVAEYLWQHYEKFAAHEMASSRKERNEALRELLEHAQKHQDLLMNFWRLQPHPDTAKPYSPGPDFHVMPGAG